MSLGDIAIDCMFDKYGFDLLDVLIKKGNLAFKYDRNVDKFVSAYYTYKESIKKYNGDAIKNDFFVI